MNHVGSSRKQSTNERQSTRRVKLTRMLAARAPSAHLAAPPAGEIGSQWTRRWRKRDSNFWSHLQRGQPCAELAPPFFRARLHRLRSFFISKNDDFELPASQSI